MVVLSRGAHGLGLVVQQRLKVVADGGDEAHRIALPCSQDCLQQQLE
jgi:hypothetical protein